MPWRIVMTFPEKVSDRDNDLLHRVRNFGETVYRGLREEESAVISLDEVDRAIDTLVVNVKHNRDLKRITRMLEKTAEADFPDRTPSLTAEKV
jgi:hypothetical protein